MFLVLIRRARGWHRKDYYKAFFVVSLFRDTAVVNYFIQSYIALVYFIQNSVNLFPVQSEINEVFVSIKFSNSLKIILSSYFTWLLDWLHGQSCWFVYAKMIIHYYYLVMFLCQEPKIVNFKRSANVVILIYW